MRSPPRVIIRHAAADHWLHFENPVQIIHATRVEDVLPALREIEKSVYEYRLHAAGWIAYEAAPAFDNALSVRPASGIPLLWFGLYHTPRHTEALAPIRKPHSLGELTPTIERHAYNNGIASIKEHIARGDTYQVNYTFRLRAPFAGSPWSLFMEMVNAQPVGYSAFIDTGAHVICSASPELFFELDGDEITCRPMKGTCQRGRTLAEDDAHAAWLQASEKNRAENVMIVDMIRNDLGRIAEIGSVHVPALFTTERYRTLWQMTSTVKARVRNPISEIMTALFPCASITGAPKVSTMNIIAALENTPRGIYTGSIGFIAPDRKAQFNVAIRTVTLNRDSGQAEYGLGGGIVWDSTSGDEYAEALLKARVITEKHPQFDLLETMLWTPEGGWFLRDEHLRRLGDSALYFGYPFELQSILDCLDDITRSLTGAQRVRLLLARDGKLSYSAAPFTPDPKPARVRLASQPIEARDVFLYHKTTHRVAYDSARKNQPDCDDVLLYNEKGELTEFTIGNLVVELDGRLYTPPVRCGLLAGTFRAHLLAQGLIHERVIRKDELAQDTPIFLINAVRKWQKVEVA